MNKLSTLLLGFCVMALAPTVGYSEPKTTVAIASSPVTVKLTGKWRAEASETSLGGTIEFRSAGILVFHPDGNPPESGKWTVSPDGFVELRLDNFPDKVVYAAPTFSGEKALTLTYDNGNLQKFNKQP